MASIDRYRPPREGYQPPTREGYQPPSVPSRLSRSPGRRKDVPPPVPTPPPPPHSSSSRASPPRPNPTSSRPPADASSPSQLPEGGPQSQPPALPPPPPPPSSSSPPENTWLFSPDEVLSSPSILDGLGPSEERLRRAKGINFIYQTGVLLDLPQITLWVAGVYFHRFYMRYSMVEECGGIHHYNIAATALFLANKVEENCRRTKAVIIAVAKVAQKNANLVIDEQSKEYWRWRDSILMYEELMLELLTFDLIVENPYTIFFTTLQQLGLSNQKHLRQSAWTFCNDACLTTLPLLMPASDIALSAIVFASGHTGHQIDDLDGQPWWKTVRADEEKCLEAIKVIDQFYRENPLRKQNPSLPSPAFHLDSTRRRGDIPPSQAETTSSNAGTPLPPDRADRADRAFDRGTQSPKPGVNGEGRGGEQSEPKERDLESEPRTGDALSGADMLTPATKRRSVESDAESDDGRAPKRTRTLSEDEGEVVD